ncbi:type II secretion system F family protein [Streptomyces sp. TR06-5]|uniref:type II secretion system F family protein n=1 Tax=unclassified Streptomyces TaxID=2593676 RepID=UPI0039A26D8C
MTLSLPTIGAALLCGVCAVVGVHFFTSGRSQQQDLVARMSDTGPVAREGGRRFHGVDRRVRGTRAGRKIDMRLAATGLDLSVGEFVTYLVALVAALWLMGAWLFAPFFGPLVGLCGFWGAFAFLNWQRGKRNEKFVNQLPELSRILANATRAGLALRTAIGMAADELEAPAGDELARVADKLAVGHSVEDALGELTERLPSRELVVLVTTLILSHRAGGTVVESLRNLTRTLDERKETRREVRTQLSQVTMTAFAVPVLGLGALLLMNQVMPGALERMTSHVLGQTSVLVAFGLYGLGFFLIRRLSKIDV